MRTTAILLLALALLSGCTTVRTMRPGADPAKRVADLAAGLDDTLRIPALRNGELGVLTFVDLNDLDAALPIGRYLQEKLVNELFRRNYRVVEIRLGKSIAPRPPVGETILTRVRDDLRENGYAGLKGLVLGTYIHTANGLQVGARLVELENGQVRASAETFIQRGKMLRSLTALSGSVDIPDLSRAHGVYERWPSLAEAE